MNTIHLICNAHLDPVWQWRWEEGCAEAISTFRTAVQLLEEHPGLIFNHNEAVLYRWVKEYDPPLFASIQRLVAAGRWAISGGWYLQPDVNLPGTESLMRHLTIGREFFREHFGAVPRVAYNFDSFGHSAGLPQILRLGGYEMYLHMRPQERELPLPGDLYRWRGLDGSEILTLRIAVGLYHTERDNVEQRMEEGVELALRLNRDVPVFWGIGDHGGGPTREDLARIDAFITREKRVRVIHSTPELLYEALRESGRSAPVHGDDLQRVFTGCYTSLARVKRQAIHSLGLLRQTEALRTLCWWQTGQPYPAEQLDRAWREHLFNDFHDILPGSCTEPAEQDALGLYASVEQSCRQMQFAAATALNSGAPVSTYIPVTILNANPSAGRVPVEVECMLDLRPKWSGKWHLRLFDLQGQELHCQEEQPESLLPFNGWRRKVVFEAGLPPVGAQHYRLEIAAGDRKVSEPAGAITLTTGAPYFRGQLFKAIVVDDPGDSWGTDHWQYRDVLGEFAPVPDLHREIVAGPIRTISESVYAYGRSRLVAQTIVYPGFPFIELRLRIDWNEQRKRLKLSLPTKLASPFATVEVPGGMWRRPADGQEHVHGRWVLLEGDVEGKPAAVALIHEGLHGFDVKDGDIRLSVLRSAAYCHEQGFKLGTTPSRKYMDQGVHEVRLLVLMGEPDVVRANVNGMADWLAAPPRAFAHLPIGAETGKDRSELRAFLEMLPPSLGLLACKKASGEDAVILRLQELCGHPAGVACCGQSFEFRPFEIKTFRLGLDGAFREADAVWEK